MKSVIVEFRTYELATAASRQTWITMMRACQPFFARHGAELADIYVAPRVLPADTNNVHYLLRFQDLEQRERAWAGLRSDEDWKSVDREITGGDHSFIVSTKSVLYSDAPEAGGRS